MDTVEQYRISSPLHLQFKASRRRKQIMSVREHLPPSLNDDPSLPLIVLTYHPGYAAGSYADRDYFELLTPRLFDYCGGRYRLRVFTINHPGYDLPDNYRINRSDMETFSIRHQPAIIEQVLHWLLLRHFAGEQKIFLIPYGHSMGGLALSHTNLQHLQTAAAGRGCSLQIQKVLSAPAFILQDGVRQSFDKIKALKTLKTTFGRLPLYERVTQGLFNALAPTIYRRDAGKYALNPDCNFVDFRRYNPFILLDQGLELLRLNYSLERVAALLSGSHLILSSDDGMVDSDALLSAARHANSNGDGTTVQIHTVNSSHNAERDDPDMIRDTMCTIVQPLITAAQTQAQQNSIAW
jgi:pimeloyl-ACP methyl ester carboxylesterase